MSDPSRTDGVIHAWAAGLGAWTSRAIDALGLERFHLVVHDLGGPIGFDVVAREPDRIASLRTLRPFAFERLMRLQGVSTPVPAAELRAYVPLLKRGDGGRAFLRIMRGFERTEAFEARILGALGGRAFPAQILWGEQDPALHVDHHGEQAREALGVDAITRLPGKHFVQEDAPEAIAEHVAQLAGRMNRGQGPPTLGHAGLTATA